MILWEYFLGGLVDFNMALTQLKSRVQFSSLVCIDLYQNNIDYDFWNTTTFSIESKVL